MLLDERLNKGGRKHGTVLDLGVIEYIGMHRCTSKALGAACGAAYLVVEGLCQCGGRVKVFVHAQTGEWLHYCLSCGVELATVDFEPVWVLLDRKGA